MLSSHQSGVIDCGDGQKDLEITVEMAHERKDKMYFKGALELIQKTNVAAMDLSKWSMYRLIHSFLNFNVIILNFAAIQLINLIYACTILYLYRYKLYNRQ